MKKLRFAIIIVFIAAILHFVPFFDGAEATVVRGFLAAGGAVRGAALSVGGFFGRFAANGELQKENAALKEQLRALNEKVSAASALFAENASLKEMLSFKERTNFELIPAEVAGTDPDATVRALVINVGTEAGVVRGAAVIAGNGTFVGKIERTAPGRSTVLLPVDPRSAIAVMVSDHPETNGVAGGEKGLSVAMTLIPQHAPLSEGDIVVTTGRETGIPRGLVVGKIESINGVPSDPFMSATVVPTIDPLALTKIAVIRAQ